MPWSKNTPCTGELFSQLQFTWGSFSRSEEWIFNKSCHQLSVHKTQVCPSSIVSLHLLHVCQKFVLRITSQKQKSISRQKACLRPKLALTKATWHGIWFPHEHFPSPQATTKSSIKVLDHFSYICIILQGMPQDKRQKSLRFLTSLVSFLRQVIILLGTWQFTKVKKWNVLPGRLCHIVDNCVFLHFSLRNMPLAGFIDRILEIILSNIINCP